MGKKILKKRKGSIFVLVIGIFVFVSVTSILMIGIMYNNRYQAVLQSENVQLYYFTKAGLDATVESLVNERGNYKIINFKDNDPKMVVPTMEFKDSSGNYIGKNEITVKRILKVEDGISRPWVEIVSKTTMKDIRSSSKNIVQTGKIIISVDNPLLREYDIVLN